MQSEGFKSHYLFDNATRCCETWWVAFHFIIAAPHCLDCSHLSSNLLALQVSGTTRLSRQWARCKSRDRRWTVAQPAILHGQLLFPDFNQNNCGFGRDYPAWMGHKSYEKYTSSDKEMSAAPNTFPPCPIVQMNIQSRPVIIGRATPMTLQTLIRYPSLTVTPTTRIWHRAPALMGEYSPL